MEKVKITNLDNFARGVTRVNDKICFVSHALPLEICEIKIINEKKNYIEAEATKLLEESKYRIMPLCPYYSSCGGCHIMHYDRQSELIFKEEKVNDLIHKFAKLDSVRIRDIISGQDYFYRNKLTLHGNNNKIGLYQEKTNKLIRVEECLLCNKKINELVDRLNKYFENTNDIIDELVIRITSLEETMLVIKGSVEEKIKDAFSDINSIYINNKLVLGKESITEVINDLFFEVYPNSFFQVNYDMMKVMYNKVIDYYKDHKDLNVLDLYCGTGTIGMLIANNCKSVVGVEVNSDAITSANRCMKRNNISNIKFHLGKVEDKIDMFNNIDSIVVDPPRAGLDKHTIETILKLNPSSIIYISCDPATLARDLGVLKENYNIKEIQPVDMFPNTYHVENICILERK